jgi:diguanylate cyclase (GGDEF)-like protein
LNLIEGGREDAIRQATSVRHCGVGEAELAGRQSELDLGAYARLSGFFAQLLAGETPEALAETIAGAVSGFVPCSGVVVQHVDERTGALAPLASTGDVGASESMTIPLVALGRVGGAVSVFREGTPFTDAEIRFVGRFADAAGLVLESARTRAKLSQLAQTDDLTGMLNRRGFFDAAERELSRATREGADTALLVIDVDDLKRVNDRFGHSLGDDLLRRVAQTISTRTRRGDIIGRLGGDEFAVVLPGATAEAAAHLAEELEHLLADSEVEGPAGPVAVTASVGISGTAGLRTGIVRLIARADVDMYRKKRKRKAGAEEEPER